VSKPDHKGAVCVTGAAGGIGLAVVQRLLEEVYAVSAWDVAGVSLANLRHESFVFETIDVRDGAAMKAAATRTAERFGFIHGLVSLAAIFRRQSLLEIDDESWDLHFAINLKGSLLAAQAVLPHLRRRKAGSIVFFSSSQARSGGAMNATYAATKGGILGLMRSMALDVAGDNIRVNAVSPAIADTAMPRSAMPEGVLAQRAAANPLKRIGTPADMAEATLFLLDPDNNFMTGQDLRVNGGAGLF
jgi:NAD(P)-dependent dehydrogenase (short-subunit alcohol dehydrogenase family)